MALVYPELIPSCIGSEGFKVLVVVVAWSSLNSFVLVLVSNDIASFQPLRQLGGLHWTFSSALRCAYLQVSFFLQTFATFFRVVLVLMSGESRSVLHSLLYS